jgi:uncharacterized repeat protein (TIGR03803 family)
MKSKSSAAVLAALAIIALTLSLAPAVMASDTETTLHALSGRGDGAAVQSGLIRDSSGNLYGTASQGGASGQGTVFELTPNGSGGWTFNVLYAFTGGAADGGQPMAGLVFDSQGNLWGTASATPDGGYLCGSVFELSPGSGGTWTFSTIYSFTGQTDGCAPFGNVILDSAGNVYGTTSQGGGANGNQSGTVFELTRSGNSWTEQTLHTFTGGNDGGNSYAGLIMDRAGNLYGDTTSGGSGGQGVVFKLHKTGGIWIESVLYAFTGNLNGNDANPTGNLTFDSAGRIYGTTCGEGFFGCIGGTTNGGVFELAPSPTAPRSAQQEWQITWLYQFSGGADGGNPYAGVVFDSAGNLYGTTLHGGQFTQGGYCRDSSYCGVVYKLTPSPWTESVVWTFTGAGDGANPYAPVILDSAGNIYGVNIVGGNLSDCGGTGCGTVYELTPQ